MGRKKIEIKKIQNSEALQVSFSKRRAGLFKKANELATLTGAEVAMVVFSPAGKPYPLGLPDLDTVVNRYLLCNPQQQPTGESSTQPPNRNRSILARDLSKRLSDVRSLLDQQRGRCRPLSELVKSTAHDIGIQCGPDYEELNLDQLEKLQKDMLQLRGRLVERMDELKRERQPQQVLQSPGDAAYHMNCLNPTPVGFANPSTTPLPFGGARSGNLGLVGSDTVNSTGYINPNTGFPAMSGFGDIGQENPFGFSDPFHDMMFSGETTGHYGMMMDQPGSGNNVAGPSNAFSFRDAKGNGSRM